MVVLIIMKLTFLYLLLWLVAIVIALDTDLKGCHLVIPNEILRQPEPQPETGPLLLHSVFKILGIRDVPASGGYFGVDILKV